MKLSLIVLPYGASFPLHSKGGTTYYKSIGSSSIKIKDFAVLSIEDGAVGAVRAMSSIEDSGFISNDVDDCVCRGGT